MLYSDFLGGLFFKENPLRLIVRTGMIKDLVITTRGGHPFDRGVITSMTFPGEGSGSADPIRSVDGKPFRKHLQFLRLPIIRLFSNPSLLVIHHENNKLFRKPFVKSDAPDPGYKVNQNEVRAGTWR